MKVKCPYCINGTVGRITGCGVFGETCISPGWPCSMCSGEGEMEESDLALHRAADRRIDAAVKQ